MWNKTALTKKLNIKYPIIQAPMAGVTTPELVAAVSNAGALGSFGAGYLSGQEISEAVSSIRQLTNHPFQVSLFIPSEPEVSQAKIKKVTALMKPFRDALNLPEPETITQYAPNFDEQMAALLDTDVEIIGFTFGVMPKKWVKACKNKKIFLIGTATSSNEAEKLEDANVDFVVAQGAEAGGHRGSFLKDEILLSAVEVLPQVVKDVDLPVISAGGMMTADDVFAALHLRAAAVQMGSAFLLSPESAIGKTYRKAIAKLQDNQTVMTRAFSGRSGRCIYNEFVDVLTAHDEIIPEYPIQNAYTRDIRKAAALQKKPECMSLWAGSFAYLAEAKPAGDIVKDLVARLDQMF
jgi:nitronate monooxygenase